MNDTIDTDPVRLGVTGLGNRGSHLLERCLGMDDVAVPAVCDVQERHCRTAREAAAEHGRPEPEGYERHDRLVERADLDGVIVASPWRYHVPMAITAMEAGLFPAMDVGPAGSVEECRELVRTAERTGRHCMLLENCCYRRHSMAVLEMVRDGLFGDLSHCECGYCHDLRGRLNTGQETGRDRGGGRDFRGIHHEKRNGDLYPTHGVGPMAKCLEINRGNRFVSLTATASAARGLSDWAERNLDADHPSREIEWAHGDVVTTVVKCAGGETLTISHDVNLPRPDNSKRYVVRGTRAIWQHEREAIHVDDRSPDHEWESDEEYFEEYEHPTWEAYRDRGVESGHGGSDYLVLRAYVDALRHGERPPIDVYDAATWMALSPLSEQSIARGSAPVSVPDFTNGTWMDDDPIFD